MSTIKIKAPAMPEPDGPWHWKNNQTGKSGLYEEDPRKFGIDIEHPDYQWKRLPSAAQLAARDAQWQERYSLLLDELRDAATSLETISRSAGKRWVLDDAGNHVENYLQHPDQIRGYAASRAAVARSALSAITEE